ncbi:conjugative transposon protein TraN [Niabella defluvii]|nr:conjugative transposon protein TraN [Niabella sp. I65]
MADKAADAENVLRVKSAVPSFDAETNFSVITDEGGFYNFNVLYKADPPAFNYDLVKMQRASQKNHSEAVLLEELGDNPPMMATQLLETIYNKNKRDIRHIGARSYGIQVLLKGIYIHNGTYYFHLEIRNKSNVPFEIDFINFKVADKKIAKRTVIQEQNLTPLRMFRPLVTVGGLAKERNVFMLDRFTITGDKMLLIEVFEKNGGRHQVLQVEHSDLVHALPVRSIHFNFK